MTYPQQPYGQPPQQGYPAQQSPQPGYPPAQPQYQQPYPQQPPPPQPEMPRGSLKAFMDQPAGADGKSLAFDYPGDRYVGTVIRNVTDADVDYQTNPSTGEIARYTDGREKFVMKVPMLITPSAMYPEGIGVFYVNGTTRNELHRAMEAAGVEPGPPRAGDMIDVTFTHEQQGKRGQNPRKVKRIVYQGGNGEAPQLPMPAQQPAQQPQSQYQQYGQYGQQPGFPAPAAAPPYAGSAPQTMQPALPNYNPQPAFAGQAPQVQFPPQQVQVSAQFPAPGTATQFPPQTIMTNQPMAAAGLQAPQYRTGDGSHGSTPEQAYQMATGQQMPPPGQYGQPQADWNPYAQQQVPPTSGALAAPPQQTATPTAPASPSSPPADWPADVPFQPGLTVQQARMAAVMNLPQVQQQ